MKDKRDYRTMEDLYEKKVCFYFEDQKVLEGIVEYFGYIRVLKEKKRHIGLYSVKYDDKDFCLSYNIDFKCKQTFKDIVYDKVCFSDDKTSYIARPDVSMSLNNTRFVCSTDFYLVEFDHSCNCDC